MTKYYKILTPGMYSAEKENHQWEPGVWYTVPYRKPIVVREWGFHGTDSPYAEWWKWGCFVWEIEQRGDMDVKNDLRSSREARVTVQVPHPQWLQNAIDFVDSIKDVKFGQPDGNPLPEWKLFSHRNAAWDAAWGAAEDAAWGAAWSAAGDAARGAARDAAWSAAEDAAWGAAWSVARDAARDASLYGSCLIAADLIDPKHVEHARRRWEVWAKGYALLCDVDGVLYVYEER